MGSRLAFAVLALALGLALRPGPVRAEAPPVLVGVALPQTGILADLAADLRKALVLWQEQTNAAGGLLGRRVELHIADDGSEAHLAGRLYEALIRERRAALLIGPFGSAAALGAAAAAERNRRVLVNATGAARMVHKAGYRYVFQVPAPLGEFGSGALELARREGFQRIALLARNEPTSREMAAQAREAAQRAGLAAVLLAPYASGTRDFELQIAAARAADTEAWIAFGGAPDAAEMVKSFRKLGYAPRMFVAQGVAEPKLIELIGQDAEFAIGIAAYDPRAATPGNAEFVRAYVRKWAAEPGLLAAQGYAAATVLEEAVKRAGTLDQERIRVALGALETGTPLGAFRVDANGVQVAARPLLVQIVRGRREIVWPEALATAKVRLPYPAWEGRVLLK